MMPFGAMPMLVARWEEEVCPPVARLQRLYVRLIQIVIWRCSCGLL
jgi:hypothetical protein